MNQENSKPAPLRIPRSLDNLLIEQISTMHSPAEARHSVSVLMDIIEEAAPLPASHRKAIRFDVLDLWRDLTSERSLRQADYIGEPAKYAAYLRYFLPWNVVRLIPILANLDFPEGEELRLLDIGSGPLTLPIALWIARPDLRTRKLSIHCSDRVRRVMETGLTILDGLRMRLGGMATAAASPAGTAQSGTAKADKPAKAAADYWSIQLSKNIFPVMNEDDEGRYDFVSSANVFNESFWRDKDQQLGERSGQLVDQLSSLLAPGGRLLLVEPGDPRSGTMLAAIREALILNGGEILGPCTHLRACPMPGAFMSLAYREHEGGRPPITPVLMPKGRHKMPWCHFVLDQSAAPEKLLKFSETAGLPKDRLVASWLYSAPATDSEAPARPGTPEVRPHGSASWPKRSLRIISDAFHLSSGGYARYACGCTGYILATGALARLDSGSRVIFATPLPDRHDRKDPKSGAIMLYSSTTPDGTPQSDQTTAPAADRETAPRGRSPAAGKHTGSRQSPGGQSSSGYRQASDRKAPDSRPSGGRHTGKSKYSDDQRPSSGDFPSQGRRPAPESRERAARRPDSRPAAPGRKSDSTDAQKPSARPVSKRKTTAGSSSRKSPADSKKSGKKPGKKNFPESS